MNDMDFSGDTVVVTGGTRGIGRAITTAFLERGATVVATYHSNTDAAETFKAELGERGARLRLERFDVADEKAVAAFWQRLDEEGIEASVLVNNSGIRRDHVMAMMPTADWRAVLDTNLTGSFLMAKQGVLSMLRRRYGRVVFITSPAGAYGFEGQANYSASKAGQVAMARSLSKEVAKRGITVNCVSPGFVATELLDDLDPQLVKAHKKSVPMKRFGKPDEIAWAVLMLAARESSYITGATLEVTGGL
jgi:3-oxoacyl-[acyl-carrier protein] reductase